MEIGNGVNAELGYGLVQEAKTLSAVPDYSYIQVPVYAIFAGSDEYLPCEANRDALRSSGGPQHFAVLPEVGHYPRSFEHKSTLFGVFDSFLKDHLDSVAAGLD
jgi:hypothetical protein